MFQRPSGGNRKFLGLHSGGGLLHVCGGQWGGMEHGEEGVSQGICLVCGKRRTVLVVGGCRELLGARGRFLCGHPAGGLLKHQQSPILLT